MSANVASVRALSAPLTCLVLASSLGLAACGSSSGGNTASSGTTAASSSGATAAASGGTCSYPAGGQAAKKASAPPASPAYNGPVQATIKLSGGDVPVTLDGKGAPCTVNSFESLAKQKYFDGTPCHRLVTSGIYVLQCGDPTGSGSGGPGYSFADELTTAKALKDSSAGQGAKTYPAGTLAMANAGPDTNGSQFFIVYQDSPLPPAYAVFGTVSAAGLDVVKAIAAKGEDDANGPGDGAPKQKVTIQSVS